VTCHELRPGIYLAHKPVGLTSFDMVRSFKHAAIEAGQKKWPIGHGGTLDPFARGLLLILSGQATRLMELIHPLPKTYEADIQWGSETDSGDLFGNIVSRGDAGGITEKGLNDALHGFLGWSNQVPPATSAKKIAGEAAYKKAHRGEEVILPPSRVYLHEAEWMSHDLPESSRLRMVCRGGFYVRSLARDLGRALGCGAHLSGLYRAAIGPWEDPGENKQTHVTGTETLPWCLCRDLREDEADYVSKGRPIHIGDLSAGCYRIPEGFPDPSAPIAAMFQSKLVALLKERDGLLWPSANLRGGI